MNTPILFLTFNRIDTTKRVFTKIRKAKPKRLYISSDGPRQNNNEDKSKISEIRNYITNNIDWNCEVYTKLYKKNHGCRRAVSESITWFFNKEPEGIILEDDCLPSKSFFKFCDVLLSKYRDNKQIMHISGNSFVSNHVDNSSYHFLTIQHCWGWASWSDRWVKYGTDLTNYNKKNILKISNNPNVISYWENILNKMKNGEIDSWAYQWAFKIIENNGLCINPSVNLVSNIGFDLEASHTTNKNDTNSNMPIYNFEALIHPKKIKIDKIANKITQSRVFGINNSPKKVAYKDILEENKLLKQQVESQSSEISKIYSSSGWKTLLMLYKIRDYFVPKILTKKARSYSGLLNICINNKQIKDHSSSAHSPSSKKIAFIDHSFHQKTGSTKFIINLLKSHFDVEVIWDESWNGKKFVDISHLDSSYQAIIFFQNPPPVETYNKIKNDNIILIPMYDNSMHQPKEWWLSYPNLKIINFSKTLHDRVVGWGCNSIQVQRYPKPAKCQFGNKNKMFFYCRSESININTVKKIIGGNNIRVHIHNTMDPGQNYISPTKSDIIKYSITTSKWYKTKNEQWEKAKNMAIFIAPRPLEGIGQGFLEAMARGKAVVAVNNPTMNEYIINGINGYLYDNNKPHQIDFSNIVEIQKNAYRSIEKGYKKWKNDKIKIINFIKD